MVRRRSFTANGENFEVRGVVRFNEVAVARAYDRQGNPVSSHDMSEEIAQDMRDKGIDPLEHLMDQAQEDVETGRVKEIADAIAELDNLPPGEN